MTFRAPNPAGLCRGSPPRRWLLLGLLCSLPPAAGCTTDEPSPEQSAGADAAGDLGVAEGRDGQVPLPDGGDPLADGGREEAGQDAASGDLGGAASDAAADMARGDLAAPDLAVEADAALALDCSLAGDAGAAADLGPLPCPPPPLPLLTVNRIPATMNGSLPFTNLDHRLEPFLLLLPRAGFTLDLIGVPGEVQRLTMIHLGCAGRDWTLLAQEAADGWSVTAPADDPLAPGAAPVLCRALLRLPCPAMTLGADGAPAPEADAIGDGEELLELTLPVLIGELTPALDPFERPETWLVVHRRDHWTLQGLLAPDGSLQLLAQRVADGRADLDEALLLVGLASDDSAPGAALVEEDGARGASAIFRQRLLRHFLAELRALFDQPPDGTFHAGSVSVHFALQGEPDAPDPADFDPRGSFSMIGLGGGDPEERNAGRARLDWNNDEQDDDATDPDLGIFTTSMIAIFLDMELARMVLAP
ncbi:MAG: hypothetical protein FJ125_15160, partial [Deltaproteobacteria bacterium]|nr:hypothetical protein [Deltaproteobacteria bacterium]